MSKSYYVYVLRNITGTFYIGVTNNLQRRVYEHKQKLVKGFTQKYNVDMLIYFEEYDDIRIALEREKQLKNWNRKKKELLIARTNPTFKEIVFS